MAASEEMAAEEADMVDMLDKVRSRWCSTGEKGLAVAVAVEGMGRVATDRADEKEVLRPPEENRAESDGGDSESGVETAGMAVRYDGDARGVVCDVARRRG